MEEPLGGGFGAVGPNAELGDIEINLEDAPLRPQAFDQHGEIGFEALAKIAASRP
jgi:hypothetical protein